MFSKSAEFRTHGQPALDPRDPVATRPWESLPEALGSEVQSPTASETRASLGGSRQRVLTATLLEHLRESQHLCNTG
eukprot:411715-Amorphochlora_amoeboformis.AAC.2